MLQALVLALALQAPARDVRSLSERELVGLIPRCGESDWITDPATGYLQLVEPLRELRGRFRSGKTLDLECWRTILIDKGYLRWRKDWPVSEPFAVCLHLPALEQGLRVRLVPRIREWKPAMASHWEMMCGLGADARWSEEEYQVLGPLDSKQTLIEFDLVPDARGREWKRDKTALAHSVGPFRIEVEPVKSVDQVLTRRDDELPARELRRGLRLEIQSIREGPSLVWLTMKSLWPSSLAASIDVHLVRGGQEFRSRNLCLNERPGFPAVPLEGLTPDIASGRRSAKDWSVRLRGVSAGALRDWDATSYWGGEIEVPLADLTGR